MQAKHGQWTMAALLAGVLMACGGSDEGTAPGGRGESSAPAGTRAAGAAAELVDPGDEPLPSQDDNDRKASAEIQDSNADAEYEKLVREIEKGG